MKLEIPFSFLHFFVALFFFLFFKRYRSSNSLDTSKKLPPQPWKLPLLGHLHHLLGALPHRALGNIADKLGPIAHLQLGEISAVVISSPIFAKEVMKIHDLTFSNRPKLLSAEIIGNNYTDIVFAPYGDYWRQMRKICILELLSAKKVRSFYSIRVEESYNLIESMAMESMEGSKTINLSHKISSMMNAITSRVAVGSRCDDQETLLALIQDVISLAGGFDLADLFRSVKVLHLITGMKNKLVKLHKKVDQILDKIVSDHEELRASGKMNHNEDLLDVLIRLKHDGGLQFPITSDNIKAVIWDMLVAGTDTSSVTIEWAMSELMKNPNVMKKAQVEIRHALKGKNRISESDIQDLSYLKLVIKETMRLHPPAPLLVPRESRFKCEIGGYHIPANTKVFVNAWKIGCDPDYWNDPESFIPDRFIDNAITMAGTDFELLPFGAGRRMCPGMTLGLANVELPLAMLLYHFNWELPDGGTSQDLDMNEAFGATLKRKFDLHLVASAYNEN